MDKGRTQQTGFLSYFGQAQLLLRSPGDKQVVLQFKRHALPSANEYSVLRFLRWLRTVYKVHSALRIKLKASDSDVVMWLVLFWLRLSAAILRNKIMQRETAVMRMIKSDFVSVVYQQKQIDDGSKFIFLITL